MPFCRSCFLSNATVGEHQRSTRRRHGCPGSWDCWLIRDVALASFLPTTASNVTPNRRSGDASGQHAQDQLVASVICSAQDGQPEHGHTGWPPLWGRCVACGWRHENHVATSSRRQSLVCASPLLLSNQSLNHVYHALCNASRATHTYSKSHQLSTPQSRVRHRNLTTRPQRDGYTGAMCSQPVLLRTASVCTSSADPDERGSVDVDTKLPTELETRPASNQCTPASSTSMLPRDNDGHKHVYLDRTAIL